LISFFIKNAESGTRLHQPFVLLRLTASVGCPESATHAALRDSKLKNIPFKIPIPRGAGDGAQSTAGTAVRRAAAWPDARDYNKDEETSR
jgi:hypothetical protein